jgi:hypothetical protein
VKNSVRAWGIVVGLAIGVAGTVGILTQHLPAGMGGLAAILAIAVVVGTRRYAERDSR